jgi:hypothetical protein
VVPSDPTQGGILSMSTPLARLYALAMEAGIEVRDMLLDYERSGGDDPAAIVGCGETIALNPALDGDDLRADILAMALEIVACLDPASRGEGEITEITAPGGLVIITRNRIPAPRTGPGAFATHIARRCGRDTISAAFEYHVSEFAG